jgi:hypothetical protein
VVVPFSRLRAKNKIESCRFNSPCFRRLCGDRSVFDRDKQLMGLDVPGVQSIADFNTPLL